MRWRVGRASPSGSAIPDLLFVVAPQNRGQILEGICKRLAARTSCTTAFHYGGAPLPPARAYFFSHYLLFLDARDERTLRGATSIVWFTHPGFPRDEARAFARQLRSADYIVATCSMWERLLLDAGVPSRKVKVVLGAADPEQFIAHRRGGGAVGFCSRYQPRKSPSVILELVRAMPHRDFRLLGSEWDASPNFRELLRQPNFTYVESEYAGYPRFYDDIDVFVSPSEIEGGPIPLVEAMMCNAVPVATRTGFAPDLIHHGENGFVCHPDAPVEEFARSIDAAYDLDTDVRATVAHLTWDAFAHALFDFVGLGVGQQH